MKVSVIGTGYVGLVSGVCFAEMGNKVTCIDIDEKKVQTMRDGKSPIYEPGLEPMMKRNIEDKRIEFSTSYDSIKEAEAVFMAVGTPSGNDGNANLKYLYAALDSLAPLMRDDIIIVLKSTVPVGTGHAVRDYLKTKTNVKFHVVNNPEFLKEGSAVNDFMKPERVILGTDNEYAYKKIAELYEPFNRQIARTIQTSNLSAEVIKYAANCFLATKISFMNEIARLCDVTGADVDEVRHGISTDSRIGTQFLYPGPGYGGSCFPKDVKALIYKAKECGLDFKIVSATEEVNQEQKLYMFKKLKSHFGDLKDKHIAFWGVAFKANTDDIRETPAEYILDELHKAGAKVSFYDPEADKNFEKLSKERGYNATLCESKYDCLDNADALLVLTEWKEFRAPDFDEIKKRLKTPKLFDGRNLYNTRQVLEHGFEYFAVGKAV
ncbi:MAG: UDP-glucose 6-dehydrogenase [Halobacteriovoraceae bacterium]|nr:UDP-glucose 6-dehydrogenase [Halobacteriovoraceae bacterium]|tara:strand:- start:3554 stop:4861 length:1308 start_codon:yes stop_codon:yes gene_type:complete